MSTIVDLALVSEFVKFEENKLTFKPYPEDVGEYIINIILRDNGIPVETSIYSLPVIVNNRTNFSF